MKWKTALFALLLFAMGSPMAFSQTNTDQLYQRAEKFIQAGDYANAIIILKKSLALSPQSALYRQELARAYSLNREYDKAEKLIKTVLKSNVSNAETFQIAGDIYQAKGRLGKARRALEDGLKKFPRSGVLYSERGQIYYAKQKYSKALQSWVKGIKLDPDYASNYYFAARTYYFSKDKFWTIVYGEVFINLERHTNRTLDMKKKLLAAYKLVISNSITLNLTHSNSSQSGFSTLDKSSFKETALKTLGKSAASSIKQGVTPSSLMMTRTRFLLNWNHFAKLVYPFYLFDYYDVLLEEGLFSVYNKWLFGPANDPEKYKVWEGMHSQEVRKLMNFMQSHPLTPVQNQFYQSGEISFIPAVD